MGSELRTWLLTNWPSWSTTLAVVGLTGVVGSIVLRASMLATPLLAGGMLAAAIGVGAHVVRTWREGHSQ